MRIVTTSFVISKLVGSFSVSKARIFVYAIHLQWEKQFVEKLELRIYTWKNALKRENQQNCALKKRRKERGLKYRKILLNNFSVGQGSFSLIHHSFISPWGARKNRDYLACFSIESTLKMYQGIRIKLQFRDHIVVQRWIFQNNWIIKLVLTLAIQTLILFFVWKSTSQLQHQYRQLSFGNFGYVQNHVRDLLPILGLELLYLDCWCSKVTPQQPKRPFGQWLYYLFG